MKIDLTSKSSQFPYDIISLIIGVISVLFPVLFFLNNNFHLASFGDNHSGAALYIFGMLQFIQQLAMFGAMVGFGLAIIGLFRLPKRKVMSIIAIIFNLCFLCLIIILNIRN
jgi:hypothetical protein